MPPPGGINEPPMDMDFDPMAQDPGPEITPPLGEPGPHFDPMVEGEPDFGGAMVEDPGVQGPDMGDHHHDEPNDFEEPVI